MTARRVGALALTSRAKEDSLIKMRTGLFYFYTLTALLCLSVVRGDNVTISTTFEPASTSNNISDFSDYDIATNDTDSAPTSSPSQVTTTIPPASSQSINATETGGLETTKSNFTTNAQTTHPTNVLVIPKKETSNVAPAIFIFIFIIILIIILLIILFLLWKKGRKYSFDLTNPDHGTPLRSIEHSGIFEQTKESPAVLEYIQDESPNESKPAANGCAGDTPDQNSSSESQNVPEENSFLSDSSPILPVKKVEFSLDLDLISETQPANQDSPKLTNQDQNENNNNETSGEIDPLDLFTEISLDEPQ